MRFYRLVILILLAGLTVILLGTAVYALQTPLPAPVAHQEAGEMPITAVHSTTNVSNQMIPFYQVSISQSDP